MGLTKVQYDRLEAWSLAEHRPAKAPLKYFFPFRAPLPSPKHKLADPPNVHTLAPNPRKVTIDPKSSESGIKTPQPPYSKDAPDNVPSKRRTLLGQPKRIASGLKQKRSLAAATMNWSIRRHAHLQKTQNSHQVKVHNTQPAHSQP
ncbi:hypothetical protein VNI00_014509 [Paramarasmius palmivorus]|uniref:Uncharacterized protein n=1 Tax=Paramarasmius palmivorus TaxID=297713 RepID=A0AAW0BTI0_9AGAR